MGTSWRSSAAVAWRRVGVVDEGRRVREEDVKVEILKQIAPLLSLLSLQKRTLSHLDERQAHEGDVGLGGLRGRVGGHRARGVCGDAEEER